jgi:ribosomal protein S20
MSSISSVSAAVNPYQTFNQTAATQFMNDLKPVGSALQNGDVSAAQNALAAFQQGLSSGAQSASGNPFGKNTQANTNYNNLSSALQDGDLTGAQTAYTSLQSALQNYGASRIYRNQSAGGSNAGASSVTATSGGAFDSSDSLLDVLA